MPRRNRVDPWGDLHAAGGRGMFTGNRGCLVDDNGEVVRHHRGSLWITCLTEYRGWRSPLARPGRWTPIFFLDDAVALAAGHRPCGLCRRSDYLSYRDSVTKAIGAGEPLSAQQLNRRLATERHDRGPGRRGVEGVGVDRADRRRVWIADIDELPKGAVVIGSGGRAQLVLNDRLMGFTFEGWTSPTPRPQRGTVRVITPPTSVLALANGFAPVLHPSHRGG